MSHSQFHSIKLILRHAWLNLWDKHMTTGRINQVSTVSISDRRRPYASCPRALEAFSGGSLTSLPRTSAPASAGATHSPTLPAGGWGPLSYPVRRFSRVTPHVTEGSHTDYPPVPCPEGRGDGIIAPVLPVRAPVTPTQDSLAQACRKAARSGPGIGRFVW